MWGRDAFGQAYHHFTNMRDSHYACGRENHVKEAFSEKPVKNLCADCLRYVDVETHPEKLMASLPSDTLSERLSQRVMSSDRKQLLIFLESLVDTCWNDYIQNYGAGGFFEGEGRQFNYPIEFWNGKQVVNPSTRVVERLISGYLPTRPDEMDTFHQLFDAGYRLYYKSSRKRHLFKNELSESVLLVGCYAFGSHRLPIFRNLNKILNHLEGRHGLVLDVADMSDALQHNRDQRQARTEQDVSWRYRPDKMSKERKALVWDLAHLLNQCYSTLSSKGHQQNYSYPLRFYKAGTIVTKILDPHLEEDDVLYTGYCKFGANEFGVCANVELILRYLEHAYGLRIHV